MNLKLLKVISNNGKQAIVETSFAEVVAPAANCSAADFLEALKPGSTMQIPLPDENAANLNDIAAGRVASLRTIGHLNQISAALREFIANYVADFTGKIAAGKG
jgi:hypothetical protein